MSSTGRKEKVVLTPQDVDILVAKAIYNVAFSKHTSAEIEIIKQVRDNILAIDEAYQKFANLTGDKIKNITPADIQPYLPFNMGDISGRLAKVASDTHRKEGAKILKEFQTTYLFFSQQHKLMNQIIALYEHDKKQRDIANGLEVPDSPISDVPAQ